VDLGDQLQTETDASLQAPTQGEAWRRSSWRPARVDITVDALGLSGCLWKDGAGTIDPLLDHEIGRSLSTSKGDWRDCLKDFRAFHVVEASDPTGPSPS